jgi:hypothetical protein
VEDVFRNAVKYRLRYPPSGLKNVLQNPHKHFKAFGSGFTELHAKLDANVLLDFAV